VEYAQNRFCEEGLQGEFVVGDFTKLPFEDNSFDLVFDRGAIACVNFEGGKKVCSEVNRVLKSEGRFFSIHIVTGIPVLNREN
jgi:ubiquinone/menaquinone biosynthesis C-methylase UbiE